MKKITLAVPEKKYDLLINFLKELRYVKVLKSESGDSKEEILKNVAQGLKEMSLIKKGILKGRDVKDFLNEL